MKPKYSYLGPLEKQCHEEQYYPGDGEGPARGYVQPGEHELPEVVAEP